MGDYASDGSSSLSPPVLLPLQELNSDFEETIEDPPDLELYHINHGKFSFLFFYLQICSTDLSFFTTGYDETTGLTSFADLDMIKMDHIGSVADILGPDPYLQDESITMDERLDCSAGEERDEVDGQTILSFASAEEMHEFAHREAGSRLTKTNDFRQIKGWRNKFHQLTPSLSPSPCSSPLYIPATSVVSTSENSTSSSPLVFSGSIGALGPSFEAGNDKKEVALGNIKANVPVSTSQLEEPAGQSDDKAKSLNKITPSPEETVEQLEDTAETEGDMVESSEESTGVYPELGLNGSISYEFAEYAASAVNFPFVEKSRKSVKKANVIPEASSETVSRPKYSPKSLEKQSPVEIAEVLPRVEIDEVPSSDIVFEDSMEDVVVQEDEYVEVYGKSFLFYSPVRKNNLYFPV